MKSLAITIRTVDSVAFWSGPRRPVGKLRATGSHVVVKSARRTQ
jgi:hypothetical protein